MGFFNFFKRKKSNNNITQEVLNALFSDENKVKKLFDNSDRINKAKEDVAKIKKTISNEGDLKKTIDDVSENANTGLQFYQFAYDYLPKKVFLEPDTLKNIYEKKLETVFQFFIDSCMKGGGLPKRDEVAKIELQNIEDNGYKITIIIFPKVEKLDFNGLPILPPIFIGIWQKANAIQYFVLGTGLFNNGGTLRQVNSSLMNSNMGAASGLDIKSFMADVKNVLR